MLPKLQVGTGVRRQSDVSKSGGAWQDVYLLADLIAAYELSEAATIRLNVSNMFEKKYLRTVEYGAIYVTPAPLRSRWNISCEGCSRVIVRLPHGMAGHPPQPCRST